MKTGKIIQSDLAKTDAVQRHNRHCSPHHVHTPPSGQHRLLYLLIRPQVTSTWVSLQAKRRENRRVPNLATMADVVTPPILTPESFTERRDWMMSGVVMLPTQATRQEPTAFCLNSWLRLIWYLLTAVGIPPGSGGSKHIMHLPLLTGSVQESLLNAPRNQ